MKTWPIGLGSAALAWLASGCAQVLGADWDAYETGGYVAAPGASGTGGVGGAASQGTGGAGAAQGTGSGEGGSGGAGGCPAGYGDCDGQEANGCETTLATSAANCGTCGVACAAGACVGGVCECNDGAKNGAETAVDCGGGTCGKCADGNACAGNTDCQSGWCTASVCGPFVPPSCQGGATGAGAKDCGWSSNANCCDRKVVTGGSFKRSFDGVSAGAMDPQYEATVADFELDTYEITVGRFRKFVEDGKGTQASPPADGDGAHPLIAGSGWQAAWNTNLATSSASLKTALLCDGSFQTWTEPAGANEKRALGCLTWYEAFAFCAWDGGRLPTEAEWNYAAAGGSEQRVHPWSNPPTSTAIDCAYANFDPCPPNVDLVGNYSPKGDGKYGQADLAGNVLEWTLDGYANPYSINPCNDCAHLTTAAARVARGGAFTNAATSMVTSVRFNNAPSTRSASVGGRCARNGP